MSVAKTPRRTRSRTIEGFDIQRHVVGAFIMREIQTRYGRDNIGYLWMLAEPGILAIAVALIHVGQGSSHHDSDLRPVPFALTGYCVFMIFRSIISRAEATLESNKALLFHRQVTILDMHLARVVLETIATTAALALLLGGAIALGLASAPARPLTLLAGILLLSWFSFALALGVSTAIYFSHVVVKFVHPAVYILFPLSGSFFLLSWIPEPERTWLSWSPIDQIFEMVHAGQFQSVETTYIDPLYIVGWCLVLTVIGLFSLRILRPHIHMS